MVTNIQEEDLGICIMSVRKQNCGERRMYEGESKGHLDAVLIFFT